jgi:hypothetical protein
VWLLIFFVIFGGSAALALNFASSHRFNDRIAITLAALVSALLTIGLRARFFGPNARRS